MRVVIGEDEALLREGLALVLGRAGLEVVAMAADAEDVLRRVAAHKPDLVICDLRMPPTHTDEGLRVARAVRAAQPDVAVLLLSQHVQGRYAAELLELGAARTGYLLKQRITDVATFGRDLHRICGGGTVLDPEVVTAMLAGARNAGDGCLDALTPRQAEVLHLMAEGRSNGAIAERLAISEKAVVRQASQIYEALGLAPSLEDHRRVRAVVRYLNRGRAE